MLSKKIVSLLNSQINKELFSAYLYLEFANFFEQKGLKGFANWYIVQSKEEIDHAMFIFHYLLNNNEKVQLENISKPEKKFDSCSEILEEGLNHEKFVIASIELIYTACMEEKDWRTKQFLDWFIKEQNEEEINAQDLISKLEFVGKDSKSLYFIDSELALRQYKPTNFDL